MKILPPGAFDSWWKTTGDAEKRRYGRTIYVTMHHRGFSVEQPIFTDAVDNCLVVVVSSASGTSGALAHINITQSGFSLKAGYATVSDELRSMTKSLGGQKSRQEVVLWKGSGFASVGNPFPLDARSDYAAHLTHDGAHGYAAVTDLMDKARPFRSSSAVLFDPVMGILFELSREEAEFVGGKLARGKGNPALSRFDLAVTRIEERGTPAELEDLTE